MKRALLLVILLAGCTTHQEKPSIFCEPGTWHAYIRTPERIIGQMVFPETLNREPAADAVCQQAQAAVFTAPTLNLEPMPLAAGESPESRRMRFTACVQAINPESPTLHEAIVDCTRSMP